MRIAKTLTIGRLNIGPSLILEFPPKLAKPQFHSHSRSYPTGSFTSRRQKIRGFWMDVGPISLDIQHFGKDTSLAAEAIAARMKGLKHSKSSMRAAARQVGDRSSKPW